MAEVKTIMEHHGDLALLGEYLDSVDDVAEGRLEEIAETLNDFFLPLKTAVEIARSGRCEKASFKAREQLSALPFDLDESNGRIRTRHGELFVVGEDGRISPRTAPKFTAWDEIGDVLRPKKALLFDIDDTLIPAQCKVSEQMTDLFVRVLNSNTTVALNTLRYFDDDGLAACDSGEGIGFLKNVFKHQDFDSRSLDRLLLYTLAATHKYRFTLAQDSTVAVVEDLEYFHEHSDEKVLMAGNPYTETAIDLLYEMEAEEPAILGIDKPIDERADFEHRRIIPRETAILYTPSRGQTKLARWRLRILQARLVKRLRQALLQQFQVRVGDGVLAVVKTGNSKLDAVRDLARTGISVREMVHFEDNFEADGLGHTLLQDCALTVVNVGSPISGPASLIQPPANVEGTRKTERVLEDYLDGLEN